MKKRHALVIMAKQPRPGQTKTRLTPPLSPQEAADLYECFLRDTLDLVRSVKQAAPFIAYWPPGPDAENYFRALAPDFELVPQEGAKLGDRLDNVLAGRLQEGYESAAAINSDSPLLPAAYLIESFTRLDDPVNDVVLGPCDDGGYYLIGWKRPYPRLVRDVQMSTDHVLRDTLAIAVTEGLNAALLPVWYDVDEAEDLRRVQDDLQALPEGAPFTRQFLKQQAPHLAQ